MVVFVFFFRLQIMNIIQICQIRKFMFQRPPPVSTIQNKWGENDAKLTLAWNGRRRLKLKRLKSGQQNPGSVSWMPTRHVTMVYLEFCNLSSSQSSEKGKFCLSCHLWQKATLACAHLVSLAVPHLPFRSSEDKRSVHFQSWTFMRHSQSVVSLWWW